MRMWHTSLFLPVTLLQKCQIENTEKWSKQNLTLNRCKSTEIIFTDTKRKSWQCLPSPPLPDIDHTSSVKILGVTFTNHLSVSQHVHSVTSSCAKHLYALKLLRAHGMCEEALQQVFIVIISKIYHASRAWWGFTSATDRQHLKAFLRRCVRSLIWLNLLKQQMTNCSGLSSRTIIFCLVYYHRNLTVVTTCARNIITERT